MWFSFCIEEIVMAIISGGRQGELKEDKVTSLVTQTLKKSACNAGDLGLIPGLGRSPRERSGYPLMPGELHGQRSLVGYSPWGCKKLDTTEQLTLRFTSRLLHFTQMKWSASCEYQWYHLVFGIIWVSMVSFGIIWYLVSKCWYHYTV